VREPRKNDAASGGRAWGHVARCVLLLVLTTPVLAAEEAKPAEPAKGEPAAPSAATASGETAAQQPPRTVEGRPREAMAAEPVTPDRLWQMRSVGPSFFDPGSGAIYYPGMSLVQLTVENPATGEPRVMYYTVPNSSAALDPSYYRAVLAGVLSGAPQGAQATKAAAQAPAGEAAQPAPPKPSRMISDLAPMLGGPSRVPLRFAVGEARLRQGKSTGAALAFEQATAEFGDDPTPLLAHAVALMAEGDYHGGAASLRRGLEGLADWHSLHVDWSAVLGGETMARSIEEDLRRQVAREPADADAVLLLAFYLFAARRDAMAVEVLNSAAGTNEPLLGSLQAAAVRRMQAGAGAARVEP
jgi:hypothetical protein